MIDPLVHGDEHVELGIGTAKKLTILHTCPTDERNRSSGMACQLTTEPPIQIFIEQYVHEHHAANIPPRQR